MRFYLSTGDISGEQHAARLLAALREEFPSLCATAMGGEILRAAGAEIAVDATPLRVMGFVEVLRHLPAILGARRRVFAHLRTHRPDAVILVDYPGFHLHLAPAIRKRFPGLPIFDYIAPKAWAWKERRVRVLRDAVDLTLCILPFEEAWFGERGVAARYVGNPVVDAVRGADGEALRRDLALAPSSRLVSLFPGSRASELRRLLPPLLEAAARLGREIPELRFALAVAPGWTAEAVTRGAALPEGCAVVEGQAHALMAASDLILAKSGTTTLEAAILDRPMVVVYAGHPVSAWIVRRLATIRYFSLPNLLLGRRSVPELFQEEVRGERIAREALPLLQDPDRIAAVKRDYAEIRARLGDAPAAARAARAIREFLEMRETHTRGV